MKTKLLLTLFFSIAIIGITNAQTGQRERIHQGVRSGELTRPEATRLRHNERRTHRDVMRAKKDGKITRAERHRIRHEQKMNSRRIYRLKHNNRERH